VQYLDVFVVFLFVLRLVYMFVEIFKSRLIKKFTFLNHLPESKIVQSPVQKTRGLCEKKEAGIG
jgi:hypothetical protein